ncbi:hypothetical protein DUI87_07725 [Hirundo rustica rustica]|uniref:Uncharacterized protein n=1 Tax=Hirundo rustica rustica TaxID=333673 RepID=A0A3M0KS78_HIRRU|nr:hypothetical protein DUI87_07725 [Hirundo rustica rustica]
MGKCKVFSSQGHLNCLEGVSDLADYRFEGSFPGDPRHLNAGDSFCTVESWAASGPLLSLVQRYVVPSASLAYVGVQSIPLAALEGQRPGQGGLGPRPRAQRDIGFDLSPWERLPALRDGLQATRV